MAVHFSPWLLLLLWTALTAADIRTSATDTDDSFALDGKDLQKHCRNSCQLWKKLKSTCKSYLSTRSCRVKKSQNKAAETEKGEVTKVSCGEPDSVSFASQSGTNYTDGAKVTYTCVTGYERTAGDTTLTCGNKEWRGTKPTCSKVAKVEGRDCDELYNKGIRNSGVYEIGPFLSGAVMKYVYCDMETDGGRWTVFQRRFDGSVDFYRNWTDYKDGFGNANGEYWLGLDIIHALAAEDRSAQLRVDLQDFAGKKKFAQFGVFVVGDSASKYKLNVDDYSGTAGDSLEYQSGRAFTTHDQDNDNRGDNCAITYHGAWWYNGCHYSHLNGRYYNTTVDNVYGLSWVHFKNNRESMKRTEMKVRPNKSG